MSAAATKGLLRTDQNVSILMSVLPVDAAVITNFAGIRSARLSAHVKVVTLMTLDSALVDQVLAIDSSALISTSANQNHHVVRMQFASMVMAPMNVHATAALRKSATDVLILKSVTKQSSSVVRTQFAQSNLVVTNVSVSVATNI